MKLKRLFLTMAVAIACSSCFFDEYNTGPNVVLSEDVIFVSGSKLRLLGRVYSAEGTIEDHGFYLSEESSFTSPTIKSLGSKKDIGPFLAEFDSLAQQTTYYYKAFMQSKGEVIFSETDTISTYDSRLYDFTPKFGKPGQSVTIQGANFTTSVRVFFGDVEAEITNIKSDFELRVKVPEHGVDPTVDLIVDLDDVLYNLGSYEYISGKWTQIHTFEAPKVYDFGFFQNGDVISMAYGSLDQFGNISTSVYKFDLTTNTESSFSLTDPAFDKIRTVGAFSTKSGYLGGGALSVSGIPEGPFEYLLSDHFWQFDGDASFTDLGKAPDSLYNAVAFELGNTLYLLGGQGKGQEVKRSLYRYNGSWTPVTSVPFTFDSQYPHCTLNGEEWFMTSAEELWRFNPATNSFSLMDRISRSVIQYGEMIAFNNQLYYGIFLFDNLFWRYDPVTDVTVPKTDFPGDKNHTTQAAFEYNGNLYFVRMPRTASTSAKGELWMLEPDKF